MVSRPLDSLIDGIYEAALDPVLWPEVLADIREGIGASAYSLFTLASAEGQKPELLTCNIDPVWSQSYRDYWWQHDAWVQGAVSRGLAAPGLTLSGSMLVETEAFQKSVWLNEALRPQDMGDLLTTTLWTVEKPGPKLVLSFYRSLRAERFGTLELNQLSALSGHLRRAFNLTLSGAQLSENLRNQSTVLDGITQPLLILDSQRKIISLNEPAERLLSNRPGGVLQIRNQRVMELGQRANPTLEAAHEWARMNPGKPIAIAFVTPRCGGLPIAGSARLMKLRNVPSWNFRLEDPDRFMLQLELSESPPAESLRAFADLFGLTQAEFRVLALMIEDISPRLIAEHLRISLPTVRTHLQRIRQKTGTRRFSDLIRLALAASKNH
ncbi:MAG: hypothetical protein RLZ25_155 [Pseudomonadota bacterium]|jgi:DNA-binding CsgD family transcriptional regulator